MMTRLLLCLSALLTAVWVHASPTIVPLDYPNAARWAVKMSGANDFIAPATELLKKEDARGFLQSKNDPVMRAQLLKPYIDRFMADINALPDDMLFEVNQPVALTEYDPASGTLHLSVTLPTGYQMLVREDFKKDHLPSSVLLLYANPEIIDAVPVSQKKYDALKALRNDIDYLGTAGALYLRYLVRLPKYQHHSNFQAVITEVFLYDTEDKGLLLSHASETRDINALINNRLLADGISNPLTGIHSYQLHGYRLLDTMVERHYGPNDCHTDAPFQSHAVVRCRERVALPGDIELDLQLEYLGGLLARMKYFSQQPMSASQRQFFDSFVQSKFSVWKQKFQDTEVFNWRRNGVRFSYHTAHIDRLSNAGLISANAFSGESTDAVKLPDAPLLLLELTPISVITTYGGF